LNEINIKRRRYEKSDNIDIVSSGYSSDIENKDEIKKTMIVQYPAVWNKIYKTELVKNHTFSKGVWYEDMEFVLKLYPHIKSIVVFFQLNNIFISVYD